jgi:hypothetical protein
VTGPIVIAVGLAVIAGLCAFLITYDEALHRFPRPTAIAHGLRTGATAFAFFAILGVILIVTLLR